MNFKSEYTLPDHLHDVQGLPRNRAERLLWIKRKVEDGYYESERIKKAVADAFLEPAGSTAGRRQELAPGGRWRRGRWVRR